MRGFVAHTCSRAGIEVIGILPAGLRLRDTGTERFWFNHTDAPITFDDRTLPAAGVIREAYDPNALHLRPDTTSCGIAAC